MQSLIYHLGLNLVSIIYSCVQIPEFANLFKSIIFNCEISTKKKRDYHHVDNFGMSSPWMSIGSAMFLQHQPL